MMLSLRKSMHHCNALIVNAFGIDGADSRIAVMLLSSRTLPCTIAPL